MIEKESYKILKEECPEVLIFAIKNLIHKNTYIVTNLNIPKNSEEKINFYKEINRSKKILEVLDFLLTTLNNGE